MQPPPNPTPPDPRQQWLEMVLAVRAELNYDLRGKADSQHVIVEDPVRGKFFQIGLEEYELMMGLDGQKSLNELLPNGGELPQNKQDQFIQIAQWLVQNNLVYSPAVDGSKRLNQQSKQAAKAKWLGWINPLSCKFTLFNPNRLLTGLQPYTSWLFSLWVFLIWLSVGGYAMTLLVSDWNAVGSAATGVLAGSKWIWMLLIWIALKLVHETAHGIACRRYGGEVPEAGVLLLLFTPMPFVNVTSMWRSKNTWQRIVVSAAGMYVELFISFLAIIVWKNHPGMIGSIAFDVFLLSSVTTILFNANPLMRFDGYFILSDLIGIPNLSTKGSKWFNEWMKGLYFGTPQTPNLLGSSERRIVQVYGVLAWCWKLTIGLSLMIAASVLFYGAGLILAVLGGITFYGMPIWNQYLSLFGPKAPHPINRSRLAWSLTLTAMLGIGLFTVLRAPATKSAPALIQFCGEQILRSVTDGFLTEIRVTDGEAVSPNQVLMVLKNEPLELEVRELEHLIEEAAISTRIKVKSGDLAESQAAAEKQAGLQKQLLEKQQQLETLTIRAPFAGTIYARNLSNRIGSFCKRGSELCAISPLNSKQILASIDQRDFESIQGQQGKFLRVAFPGIKTFSSKLTRINPRASVDPQESAWGANAGGPLPVRPALIGSSGEPRFELVVPRFTVELQPDDAFVSTLNSGVRGYAFFDAKDQSLGSYLYLAIKDWLTEKIEMATQSQQM